jgi:hypothetical protein
MFSKRHRYYWERIMACVLVLISSLAYVYDVWLCERVRVSALAAIVGPI